MRHIGGSGKWLSGRHVLHRQPDTVGAILEEHGAAPCLCQVHIGHASLQKSEHCSHACSNPVGTTCASFQDIFISYLAWLVACYGCQASQTRTIGQEEHAARGQESAEFSCDSAVGHGCPKQGFQFGTCLYAIQDLQIMPEAFYMMQETQRNPCCRMGTFQSLSGRGSTGTAQ